MSECSIRLLVDDEAYLGKSPAELNNLFHQLLVGVIWFFRNGGLELGDRLSALCKDLRIIFISGGAVDTARDGLRLSSKRFFVGKPIQPGALLEVIRTCLNG